MITTPHKNKNNRNNSYFGKMIPQAIQELIKTLPAESQAVVKAIALIYENKFKKQEKRIQKLEDQIAKKQ